ncbi:hypothetical protein DKX38_003442 [Salix brachista]|uniref:Uncharacterized protein n=1 Tax=Salix brachista TaxID=2182728 RepID=A0A5N5NR06_9ROSI|nr:hypothetical protein DKX38_003442 [Salix brachista]
MGHPDGDATCIFPLLQFKADGIDGNVDSKPEVPSLPPSIMSSEKQITPSSSTSQAKTGIKELYLESVYKKDVAHEFYCPNCNSCIQKVMIHCNEEGSRFRWSSCFSFLIQICNYQCSFLYPCSWFFLDLEPTDEDTHEKGDILNAPLSSELRALECKIFQGKKNRKTKSNVALVVSGPEAVTSPDMVILERTTGSELRGAKIFEIVKSIVYGGLIGSITSLNVVKSAARSGAATSSIVALSLANLIGGIFTFAHNVIPPAVYGFTVMETDDKNLKLAAVAVASFLCVTILAIGKACIKKPPKNNFRIVLRCLVTAIMVSVVSIVVGDRAKKLIEKLGWFKPGKAFPLPLAEKSSGRLAWASY